MVDHRVTTTDAEIEAALKTAKLLADEPLARDVVYFPSIKVLIIHLSNGRRLAIPKEDIQGMVDATARQLRDYELLGGGTGIHFPRIDVDLYIPALIEGVYGNRRWMAALGKKGGAARTGVKQQASRMNGAKGGRPRKQVAAAV